jgi:hypothetical protein
MRNLTCLIAVALAAIAIVGCACPTPPASVSPPEHPMIRGCNICRWVDAKGIVSFSECRLPSSTPVAGWEPAGGCTYQQIAPGTP